MTSRRATSRWLRVEYFVLVSQREVRVELYARQSDGSFRFTVHGPTTKLELGRFGVVDVDELYATAWDLGGDDAVVVE